MLLVRANSYFAAGSLRLKFHQVASHGVVPASRIESCWPAVQSPCSMGANAIMLREAKEAQCCTCMSVTAANSVCFCAFILPSPSCEPQKVHIQGSRCSSHPGILQSCFHRSSANWGKCLARARHECDTAADASTRQERERESEGLSARGA